MAAEEEGEGEEEKREEPLRLASSEEPPWWALAWERSFLAPFSLLGLVSGQLGSVFGRTRCEDGAWAWGEGQGQR